jgi:hypothetical protein
VALGNGAIISAMMAQLVMVTNKTLSFNCTILFLLYTAPFDTLYLLCFTIKYSSSVLGKQKKTMRSGAVALSLAFGSIADRFKVFAPTLNLTQTS